MAEQPPSCPFSMATPLIMVTLTIYLPHHPRLEQHQHLGSPLPAHQDRIPILPPLPHLQAMAHCSSHPPSSHPCQASTCTKSYIHQWPSKHNPKAKASQALLEISYSEPFSVSLWIIVDHHRRARTHSRSSRRDPLSINTLRGPWPLRQSLHRRAASRPEVIALICVRVYM